MATPTQSAAPPDPSSTRLSSPSPSPTDSGPLADNLPPVALCLYIFSIILVLFVMILGVLVTRSVRRRRQRNAAFVAGLASGTNGLSSIGHDGGKNDPDSKPVLWETLIASVYDEEKGWAGLLPLAGVMSVPVHEAMSQQPASRQPRLRFPHLDTGRPTAPDSVPTASSLESLASSSGPICLTVLVSMPTPLAHGKASQGNRGLPVVELGVAQVACTPNVS